MTRKKLSLGIFENGSKREGLSSQLSFNSDHRCYFHRRGIHTYCFYLRTLKSERPGVSQQCKKNIYLCM